MLQMLSVAEVHNEPAILAYLFLTGAADWIFTTGHPHSCRRQRERRLSWELHFTGPGLFFEVSRLCASAPMSGCGRTGAREPSTVRPGSAMASRSAPHSTVMWQNDVSSASVLGRTSYSPVREAQRALPASRQALTSESPPRRARRTRLRGGHPPPPRGSPSSLAARQDGAPRRATTRADGLTRPTVGPRPRARSPQPTSGSWRLDGSLDLGLVDLAVVVAPGPRRPSPPAGPASTPRPGRRSKRGTDPPRTCQTW